MDNLAPLHDRHRLRIFDYFGQLISHDASFLETVKIKMPDRKFRRLVFAANRKCRTGDFITAASTTHQATGKGRFAATKIADELDDFTASQFTADCGGELLGVFGTRGFCLPRRVGTHIPHILPREQRRRQAQPGGSVS